MRLIGLLVVVGFVGAYFWQIVTVAAIAGLVWCGLQGYRTAQHAAAAEARRRAALIARADAQHSWALAGDLRGLYGNYPPAL